jgi:hypothetical protein
MTGTANSLPPKRKTTNAAWLTRRIGVTSLALVLHCIGRVVTILALCCAIGLHWFALQSFAWTTMIVKCSKQASLREAIAETLDGAHPCSLCHAIAAGQESEKKSELQPAPGKIDMTISARIAQLFPPVQRFYYPATKVGFTTGGESPPVPPPRAHLS